ncbi:hypothetical protein THERMOT_601 [Bathymodiolus thermophilus thioautotrophic gill symbiont]|nr:hypothetical protein THERMOT_601 [Bathymodiolus thermophilus thioautotrophic gill symbiont]
MAINIKTNTTANTPSIPDKTRYLHYDNLGSIDTITDGQGNIVERMAYTAFGQRRQGDWRASDPLLPIIPTLTNRGLTGHEHIDEMGFIHMNGRVYDPQIGRFLGADPTIQHPYNTQDYNRYSYATNNPLKYVDMNGFGWFSEARRNIANSKKCGRQITSIGVLFIFPGVNIYTAGFLSSMIASKGDLKQGGLSAFTAGFNAGVLHPMKAGFGKLIAHGLTGGICSRLSGGSFKSGFLGSTISYGASWSGAYEAAGVSSQAVTWRQRAQNVVASYVVAAELGSGKFKNGGMSAAFSRIFNDTLTMSGSLRIPTWIQKALGIDVPMQSLDGGFALSYLGFGNDEWDLGLYGQIALGGVDIGIGKATLDFGWQTGSVSSINGIGGNIGAHYGMYGASMTTGNNGNINGFNVHVGSEYNASATGTMNGSCSIRHWSCSN